MLADRDQLDRALSNLIDNAVVHGDRADILVVTRDDRVTCTIDDDGPGLTPDQIDAVFTPFHRLDASRNRNTGGPASDWRSQRRFSRAPEVTSN